MLPAKSDDDAIRRGDLPRVSRGESRDARTYVNERAPVVEESFTQPHALVTTREVGGIVRAKSREEIAEE